MTGETTEIRSVAARVRHEGDRVRQLAVRVDATRDLQWRSPAAEAFRDRVAERVAGLVQAARAAHDAADAVERHARACESRLTHLGWTG
jgi:hypothetical protein